jgi:hypothetical protein
VELILNKSLLTKIIVGIIAIGILGGLMSFLRKQNEGVGVTGEERQEFAYLRDLNDKKSTEKKSISGVDLVIESLRTCNPAYQREKSLSNISSNKKIINGATIHINDNFQMNVYDLRKPMASLDLIEVDGRIESLSNEKVLNNIRVTIMGTAAGLKKYVGDFKVGDAITFSGSVRFYLTPENQECWLGISIDLP